MGAYKNLKNLKLFLVALELSGQEFLLPRTLTNWTPENYSQARAAVGQVPLSLTFDLSSGAQPHKPRTLKYLPGDWRRREGYSHC